MYDNQSGITEQNGEVSYFKLENVRMHDNPPPQGGHSLYGMYRCVQPQRVCFSAVLAINRESVLADFGHLGHKKAIVFTL